MSNETNMNKDMRTKWNNLRKRGVDTDTQIITNGNETILGHKLILSAVSWTVANKLQSGYVIDLRDFDKVDIEKIIEFIYTDNINIKQTNDAIKFFEISKKINLVYLEDITTKILIKECENLNDCFDIWRIARKEQKHDLQKKCEQNINGNFKKIMEKVKEKIQFEEVKYFLTKSKLVNFEKYEIIKEWGELEDSMDRKFHVSELFRDFIVWSEIDFNQFEKISCDPYMKGNFKDIIVDVTSSLVAASKSIPTKTKQLKKQIIDWDSYPESD